MSPSFCPASPASRPHPSTWADIDLAALCFNARQLAGAFGTDLLAVVKANAYGHGAPAVARALLDSDATRVKILGVARVDEGIELREAGIEAPILILSAILPDEAACAVEFDLMPTLFTPALARALNDAAHQQSRLARAHLKIDTGMGRLGVAVDEAAPFFNSLRQYEHLKIEGIYTHFACADEMPDEMSCRQLEVFERALHKCGVSLNEPREMLLHAANSAAALRYSSARYDLARPGLALYGVNPLGSNVAPDVALKPVMTLRSRVTFVKSVPRGATVSYGATWRAERPSRIATIPIGYADGYARRLSNRAQVLIGGRRAPLVGRVTMDQILVDVTDMPVEIGDIVTLWGDHLPVEEVAEWAETIAYELLCAVAPRVTRVYEGSGYGVQGSGKNPTPYTSHPTP